jgi:hypothetical protein
MDLGHTLIFQDQIIFGLSTDRHHLVAHHLDYQEAPKGHQVPAICLDLQKGLFVEIVFQKTDLFALEFELKGVGLQTHLTKEAIQGESKTVLVQLFETLGLEPFSKTPQMGRIDFLAIAKIQKWVLVYLWFITDSTNHPLVYFDPP